MDKIGIFGVVMTVLVLVDSCSGAFVSLITMLGIVRAIVDSCIVVKMGLVVVVVAVALVVVVLVVVSLVISGVGIEVEIVDRIVVSIGKMGT